MKNCSSVFNIYGILQYLQAPRVLLPSQRDNLLNSSSDSIDLTVNDSSPKSRKQCGQELSITDELKCSMYQYISII